MWVAIAIILDLENARKEKYSIESSYAKSITPIETAISEMIQLADRYKDRISPELLELGKRGFN